VTQPPPRFLIPPGEPFPGQVILTRFTLVECVGEGAQGVVWRALAGASGETVALKFVHPASDASVDRVGHRRGQLAAAQRELAALRLLELPGLVHLVDAGEHEGGLVVAMAWVEGRPFPGPRDGARWNDLSEVVINLLATLQRLHGVGLAHRDLKPSNVLIDVHGRPVLLDLGVAGGAALRAAGDNAGTPRYQPPEVQRGAASTQATDLFALGVMLFEALAHGALRDDPYASEAALQRQAVLLRLRGRAPHEVADLIASLLDPDLGARVTSAEQALRELTGATSSPDDDLGQIFAALELTEGPVTSFEQYRALFDARARVLDDQGYAARALLELAGSEPSAARRELRAWLRAGIGEIVAQRVRLRTHDIERLVLRLRAESPTTRTLVATVLGLEGLDGRAAQLRAASGAGTPGVDGDSAQTRLRELLDALERRTEEGALEGVLAEVPVLVLLAQDLVQPEVLDDALAIWMFAALSRSNRRALEALLFAIERDGLDRPSARAAGLIAQAGLAALVGALDRATDLLAMVEPTGHYRLGWCHHAVAQVVARGRGAGAARLALASAHAWARGIGRAVSALHTWEGWCLYLEGEFDRAVEQHLAAAQSSRGEHRMTTLLSAGIAAEFADRNDLALECVREVRATASCDRHVFARIRAAALEVSSRYALGEPLVVDEELVAVLQERLVPFMAHGVLLMQAAIAWRNGDQIRALDLARAAIRESHTRGPAFVDSLPRALLIHLGARDEAFEFDLASEPPLTRLQCAALLASASPRAPQPYSAGAIRAAWEAARRFDLDRRREVLSLRECHDILAAHGVSFDHEPA
jgi:hypothetical protein